MDLFYAHLALRASPLPQGEDCVRAIIVKAISLNRSQQPIEQAPPPSERLYNGPETYSLHIRVRAFAAFGDETVDPRRDNGQQCRAELEHGSVESAETRSSNARSRAAFKTAAVANDVS